MVYIRLLCLKHAFAKWKNLSLANLHAETIGLTHEIAWDAYNLPGKFHNDPADRVLVATAKIERLTLMTADDLILKYPHVRVLCATT